MHRWIPGLLAAAVTLSSPGAGAGEGEICPGPAYIRGPEDVRALAHCREIDGNLRILDSTLADLHGLEGLVSVRYLVVAGNGSLRDLSGLDGLRQAVGVTVQSNAALASLRGLENLRRLESLVVDDNPSLEDLDGLGGLHSADTVTVVANPRLHSLRGLSRLRRAGALEIVAPAAPAEELSALHARVAAPASASTMTNGEARSVTGF